MNYFQVLYEQMPVIYIYAINTTAGQLSSAFLLALQYDVINRTEQISVGSWGFMIK
jgi:hypothetical protein